MKLLSLPEFLRDRRSFWLASDFFHYTTTEDFTSVLTDSGTATVGDAAGGILTIAASDGTVADNDEGYVKSTAEAFLFAADKPLLYEARIQFTEANTDDANVAVGFMSAVAANSILDNGGGPAASYSGAVLFKVDGGTVWQFETSIGGTQITTATQHTAGGAAYQTLRIEVREQGAVLEAVPFLDGQQMLDAAGRPIKHTFAPTSATEMNAFAGVKNGDTNMESLLIDYITAGQLR